MENQTAGNSSGGQGSTCSWCKCIDFQFIMTRAKDVILNPRGSWQTIKNESLGIKDVYMRYLVVMAAIPVVFRFIKFSIIGYSIPFIDRSLRAPFFSGLLQAIVFYLLSLLGVYIFALVLEKLAPKFEGQVDLNSAFKLVAFAMTPSLLAGIFYVLPITLAALLQFLAGCYGIYLGYLGICELTTVPSSKRILYYIISIVTAAICLFIIGLVVTLFLPSTRPDALMPMPNININLDQLQGH